MTFPIVSLTQTQLLVQCFIKIFAEFIHRIKDAFNEDGITNVIADATHLSWGSRRKLLNALGREKGENVIPVVIKNNLEEILFNNDKRIGRSKVPHSTVCRMYSQMTDPITDPIKYKEIRYIDNHRREYDLDNI